MSSPLMMTVTDRRVPDLHAEADRQLLSLAGRVDLDTLKKITVIGADAYCLAELGKSNPPAAETALRGAARIGRELIDLNCAVITGETSGAPETVVYAANDQINALERQKIYRGATLGFAAQGYPLKEPAFTSRFLIETRLPCEDRRSVNATYGTGVIVIGGRSAMFKELLKSIPTAKIIGILAGSGHQADELIANHQVLVAQITKVARTTRLLPYPRIIYDCDPVALARAVHGLA